ncbi:hypothetical protein LCGC14_1211880 [marine sediment metagenome]|uniref:Uncharacterized protein n=1 Tax=marine sediment metagenome TaxID=412755 RepID=A0A0F9PID7_9ZZZZ
MNVKGYPFIAITKQLVHDFDKERWNDFFQKFKASNPYFNQFILPTTLIPVEKFIKFLNAMLKEFYNGDEKIYWRYGEEAAKTSLSEKGPFHIYVKRKREPKDFITKVIPRIWKMYYEGGSTKNVLEGNIMHAYILDLPLYHPYFEYTTMGYRQKALELMGIQVGEFIKVKGTAKETYYKFVLEL